MIQNSDKFFLTMYTYIVCMLHGWYIISFGIIFFNLNEKYSLLLLQQRYENELYIFILTGLILLTGIFYFIIRKKSIKVINENFRNHVAVYVTMFLLICWNYISYGTDNHFNIIEFLVSILSLISINYLSKVFYIDTMPAWYHPTTRSIFFINAILTGSSIIIITGIFQQEYTALIKIIILILIIESLIIFARLKYLSKKSSATHYVARLLLGKYSLYFSIRIIIGIFMPLGYCIYAMWGNMEFIKAAAVTILIGELLERMLFLYVIPPSVQTTNPNSAKS